MSVEQDVLYSNLKQLSDFNLDILTRATKVPMLQSHESLTQFKKKTASLDETLLVMEDILAHGESIYTAEQIEQTFTQALSLEQAIKTHIAEMQVFLKGCTDFESTRLYAALQNQPPANLQQVNTPGMRTH